MKLVVVNEDSDIDELIAKRLAEQGFVKVERKLIEELAAGTTTDARTLDLKRLILYSPEHDAYVKSRVFAG